MGTSIYNLDTIIADMIAKPVTRDGYVLYSRVDNMAESLSGGTSVMNEQTRQISNRMYNSPDNLRKLMICYDGVYVQYHQPIKGGDGRLFKKYEWEKDFTKVLDDRKACQNSFGIFNANANKLEVASNTYNGMEIDIIKGFGLGALNRPWVYQNVEEIYFDELLFTCYNKHKQKDFSSYYNGSKESLLQFVIGITIESVCGTVGEIDNIDGLKKKFPRLHTIGYLRNLGSIIESNSKHINGNDEKKEDRPLSLVDKIFNIPQDKYYSQIVNDDMVICRLYKNRSWMMEYSKKTGIYLFDSILEEHFESLKAQYIKNAEQIKQQQEKVNVTYNEYDIELLTAYDLGGDNLVANIIKTNIICKKYTREQLKEYLEPRVYARFSHLI